MSARADELRGADMQDADGRAAELRGADMRDADGRGADRRGTDRRGTDGRGEAGRGTAAGMTAGTVVDDLRAVLSGVVTDPAALEAYRHDSCDLAEAGRPLAAVLPRTTAEVAGVLRVAAAHGVPVVPQGARTGLAGGANAVDGSIVLSTTRMDRVLEVDPANRLIVVQPGVLNAAVTAAAAPHGLWYPPDPGSRASSTIGGNVATDAGGMCCVKYGVTGSYVLGLEVVLADGSVLRTGRRTAKGVAGYDLTSLLVGSEGTLGVITEVTLALRPRTDAPLSLVAVFDSTVDAGAAVGAIVAAGCTPSLLELIDRVHLRAIEAYRPMDLPVDAAAILLASCDTGSRAAADLDAVASRCRAAGATEVVVAEDPDEAEMLLEARRLAYPAMERLGRVIVDDVAVPRSRLAEMLAAVASVAADRQLTIGVIAHAGDGNLHPNIVVPHGDAEALERGRLAFDDIMRLGLSMGGTVTGEHGVGLLKREWLAVEAGPVGMRLQRAVKDAFDPAHLLNPGKLFLPPG